MALLYEISPSRRIMWHCSAHSGAGSRRGSRFADWSNDSRTECQAVSEPCCTAARTGTTAASAAHGFRACVEFSRRVKAGFSARVTSGCVKAHWCALSCAAEETAFRSGTAPRTAHPPPQRPSRRAGGRRRTFSEISRTRRNDQTQHLGGTLRARSDIHAAREQNAQPTRGIANAVNQLKLQIHAWACRRRRRKSGDILRFQCRGTGHSSADGQVHISSCFVGQHAFTFSV